MSGLVTKPSKKAKEEKTKKKERQAKATRIRGRDGDRRLGARPYLIRAGAHRFSAGVDEAKRGNAAHLELPAQRLETKERETEDMKRRNAERETRNKE